MGPVIRPARPQDAGFLAWTILTAGRAHLERGWYDIALELPEREALDVLARLVMSRTPCWWRYSNFLLAEVDGVRAGALCAFAAPEGWGSSEAALAEATAQLGWGPQELADVWDRGGYVFTCTFGETGRCWVVENVATRPEYRGRGVMGALLRAALDKGRVQGLPEAQLSFLIGNAAAERAYLKAGFLPAGEQRHPVFEAATGAPGLKRFLRAL